MEDGSSNIFPICGEKVAFPSGKKPFGAQFAVMSKIINALRKEEHALLESPTGTGKTLALLCSSLTWQRREVQTRLAEKEKELKQLRENVAKERERRALEKVNQTLEKKEKGDLRPGDRNQQEVKPGGLVTGGSMTAEEILSKYTYQGETSVGESTKPKGTVNQTADEEKNRRRKEEEDDLMDFEDYEPKRGQNRQNANPNAERQRNADTSSTTETLESRPDHTNNEIYKYNGPKATVFTEENLIPEDRKAPRSDDGVLQIAYESEKLGKDGNSRMNIQDPLTRGLTNGKTTGTEYMNETEFDTYVSKTAVEIKVPKIFFCSRTHTQIAQMIKTFRQLPRIYHNLPKYGRIRMTVLGSRNQYCVNKKVKRKGKNKNINEECAALLKGAIRCRAYRQHMSLSRVSEPLFDIEDLVRLGTDYNACPYFYSKALVPSAHVVFCPYNYLLDPMIRKSVDGDLAGAVVIIDEAHNIEDVARDAVSCELAWHFFAAAAEEFDKVKQYKEGEDLILYQTIYTFLKAVCNMLSDLQHRLIKQGFESEWRAWEGREATEILQQCLQLDEPVITQLEKCLVEIQKEEQEENASDEPYKQLSGTVLPTLERFLYVVKYLFKEEGRHKDDFRMVVTKSRSERAFRQQDSDSSSQWKLQNARLCPPRGWSLSLNLWCMNPALGFLPVAQEARSVVLTSGTLAPLSSFSSELGVPFKFQVEAGHVIRPDTQLRAFTVRAGPGRASLCGTYKNTSRLEYQDAAGRVIAEYLAVVPQGALVFFPSYSLMEKLEKRWRETGVWNDISARKCIVKEPRAADEFDLAIQQYTEENERAEAFPSYLSRASKQRHNNANIMSTNLSEVDSLFADVPMGGDAMSFHSTITATNNTPTGTLSDFLRPQTMHKNSTSANGRRDSDDPRVNTVEDNGAVMMAVFRGKISEGIDFSDSAARAVFVIGIPFPHLKDPKIMLKMKYQDKKKAVGESISGRQWYSQQAFRAVNQAVGRCIRHRNDFGSIIFLDPRYNETDYRNQLSKWLRTEVRQCDTWDEAIEPLRRFYAALSMPETSKSEDKLEKSAASNGVVRDGEGTATKVGTFEANAAADTRKKRKLGEFLFGKGKEKSEKVH